MDLPGIPSSDASAISNTSSTTMRSAGMNSSTSRRTVASIQPSLSSRSLDPQHHPHHLHHLQPPQFRGSHTSNRSLLVDDLAHQQQQQIHHHHNLHGSLGGSSMDTMSVASSVVPPLPTEAPTVNPPPVPRLPSSSSAVVVAPPSVAPVPHASPVMLTTGDNAFELPNGVADLPTVEDQKSLVFYNKPGAYAAAAAAATSTRTRNYSDDYSVGAQPPTPLHHRSNRKKSHSEDYHTPQARLRKNSSSSGDHHHHHHHHSHQPPVLMTPASNHSLFQNELSIVVESMPQRVLPDSSKSFTFSSVVGGGSKAASGSEAKDADDDDDDDDVQSQKKPKLRWNHIPWYRTWGMQVTMVAVITVIGFTIGLILAFQQNRQEKHQISSFQRNSTADDDFLFLSDVNATETINVTTTASTPASVNQSNNFDDRLLSSSWWSSLSSPKAASETTGGWDTSTVVIPEEEDEAEAIRTEPQEELRLARSSISSPFAREEVSFGSESLVRGSEQQAQEPLHKDDHRETPDSSSHSQRRVRTRLRR